jgi:hypothetical protein
MYMFPVTSALWRSPHSLHSRFVLGEIEQGQMEPRFTRSSFLRHSPATPKPRRRRVIRLPSRSLVRRLLGERWCFVIFPLTSHLSSSPVLTITWTSLTVWIISALLAAGIGWSRWEQKKTRDKYLAELAAMDADKREKLLSRLNPKLAMEVRQQLMLRYGIS